MNILNEVKEVLTEVTKVNFKGNKFVLKLGTNEDPNKTGVKIQFYPVTFTGMSKQQQDDIAMELQRVLNQNLASLGFTVERDRDLKDKTIIGFFLYIEQFNKVVVDALTQAAAGNTEQPKQ